MLSKKILFGIDNTSLAFSYLLQWHANKSACILSKHDYGYFNKNHNQNINFDKNLN